MVDLPELGQKIAGSLLNDVYECTICSETVKRNDSIWSCPCCYSVFHLICIEKWVTLQLKERGKKLPSSFDSHNHSTSEKFNCPLCRALVDVLSCTAYHCYCGKVKDPKIDLMLVPGSCGQPCERRRADAKCPHRCSLLCHPGPCPPCGCTREQACYCGKEIKMVGCSSMIDGFECNQPCGKLLDCGRHHCEVLCHTGPCPICKVLVTETCYCGATSRTRLCKEDNEFSCNKPCAKLRDCGNHICGLPCHAGSCDICLRLPSRRHLCPCGKNQITVVRTSCTDPIPSCGEPCELPLQCGHSCWYICHDDSPCAPCKEIIKERCACLNKEYSFPCFCISLPQDQWIEAAARAGIPKNQLPPCYPLRCNKVCRKLLSCKKHKCDELCCTDVEHICYAICLKKLSCGQHQCGKICHPGPCSPCQNVSYTRLYCHCRRTFIDPPVPCGAKPPKCKYPCIKPRPCGHPANHLCHTDSSCPVCVVPVEKLCSSHGKPMPYHMACYLTSVSCGKRCEKVIPCCGKICSQTCHSGACEHDCSEKYPTLLSVARKAFQ
ncbi:unnamed protein product [Phytomonas sp. EM1]|nr:unnamed protein product [Phytomonas sp. EM1]|eukprot:CCW59580.1 unnamed protein product [Phytomonas sp. isolate EM1]